MAREGRAGGKHLAVEAGAGGLGDLSALAPGAKAQAVTHQCLSMRIARLVGYASLTHQPTPAITATTRALPAQFAPSCFSSTRAQPRSARRWRRGFVPTFLRPKPNTSRRKPEPWRMTCGA